MVNSNFLILFEISLKLYFISGFVCYVIFLLLFLVGDVLKLYGNEVFEDFEYFSGLNW